MFKLILSVLISLNMWSMEGPKHRKSWEEYLLKDLLDATKSKTEAETNEKREYAEFCKNLYEKIKIRMDELTKHTNGQIVETQDPAQANYKNVYIKQNVMECSPSDIIFFRFSVERSFNDYEYVKATLREPACIVS